MGYFLIFTVYLFGLLLLFTFEIIGETIEIGMTQQLSACEALLWIHHQAALNETEGIISSILSSRSDYLHEIQTALGNVGEALFQRFDRGRFRNVHVFVVRIVLQYENVLVDQIAYGRKSDTNVEEGRQGVFAPSVFRIR